MTDLNDVPLALPSATVILIREIGGLVEVFMGQRAKKASWGHTYVFPGGTVTVADEEADARCRGITAKEASNRLRVETGGLEFYSAAIRELLEETGVLLARHAQGDWASLETATKLRAALTLGHTWSQLLLEQDLELAADALHYVGHWETPLTVRPRFSNRFFLAELPPGHEPRHDGRELVDSRWLTPAQGLELGDAREIQLPFPHMKHLEMLAGFSTGKSLLAWARDRHHQGISRVRPWVITEGDKRRFVLPGEPDYPEDDA